MALHYVALVVAEREGFEPSRLLHPNALAKRPLRPLGYLSKWLPEQDSNL